MGKSSVLVHKSGNISETRKNRGKVTMEGLWEITNDLRNGIIPQEEVKLRISNLAGTFAGSIRTKAHSKPWAYPGTAQIF